MADPEVLATRWGLWNHYEDRLWEGPGFLTPHFEQMAEAVRHIDEHADHRTHFEPVQLLIVRPPAPVPAVPADDEVRYAVRYKSGALSSATWRTESDARKSGAFTGKAGDAVYAEVVEIRPVPLPAPTYEVTVRFTSRENAERASQGTKTSVALSKLMPRSPWHGAEVGPVVEVVEK